MKNHIGPYRIYILLFLSVFILAEIIWSWKKEKGAYDVRKLFPTSLFLQAFSFQNSYLQGIN